MVVSVCSVLVLVFAFGLVLICTCSVMFYFYRPVFNTTRLGLALLIFFV